MLENKNQAIVSGLLAISITGFVGATALQFNDRIEYRIGNRIETNPAWLVPPKAEFKALERGYGGIKITLALLATGASAAMMLIARKEGELEPVRQRIKKYQEKAHEFNYAAESAYQMAATQQRYKTLLEAEDVAFQGEIETAYCESLGIDPRQQQAQITGTTTLDSVANPSDKVEATNSPVSIESGPQIPQLTWYPSVLVYGAPGSGKTTFADEEVGKRLAAGHTVTVLDPHAAYGAWEGCEVIGGGMNYDAINAKLAWFTAEIKRRYERVQNEPNPKFKPLTFVCDEFTHWGSKCENSAAFFEEIVTDIRKVEMLAIIISHTRTLAGLANAKGFSKLRDEALLEIEILGNLNPKTGRATPRFEAMVKLPGQSLNDRTFVKLEQKSKPKASFPDASVATSPESPGTVGNVPIENPETSGNPDGKQDTDLEALLAEVLAEASPPIFSVDCPLLEHTQRVQLARLVIAQNLGKEKTILLLWGVRPGGRNHAMYTEARAMLDRLIKGEE